MEFYERLKIVCERIPEGKVTTYGQLALLCGKPKNARQVGHALKRGLAGQYVPAHRVVNAKGILSGASSFEMPDLQKMLLEQEGVEVCRTEEGWKVDLREYGWKNTEQDALTLREEFERKKV